MQVILLLENVNASAVLADKVYGTNRLRKWLEEQGINPSFHQNQTGKKRLSAIIGIIRSGMRRMYVRASSSTTALCHAI
ncbi:MAG: hypothetical protein ACXW1Z_20920 [Methylobacter sp.]